RRAARRAGVAPAAVRMRARPSPCSVSRPSSPSVHRRSGLRRRLSTPPPTPSSRTRAPPPAAAAPPSRPSPRPGRVCARSSVSSPPARWCAPEATGARA
ncbi:MAG: hypothetical protein AVDCRST_MAG07-412, partial [uncultured Frankineae bacterium]